MPHYPSLAAPLQGCQAHKLERMCARHILTFQLTYDPDHLDIMGGRLFLLQRLIMRRFVASAALALTLVCGLGFGAERAEARTSFSFSVGIPLGGYYGPHYPGYFY